MWYIAYRYPDKEIAGSSYQRIETMLRNNNQDDFSVFRLVLGDSWHVVCIGKKPAASTLSMLHKHLSGGTSVQLPPDTYNAMVNRRIEREDAARSKATPDRKNVFTETHNPFHITEDGKERPASMETLTRYGVAPNQAGRDIASSVVQSNVPGLAVGTPLKLTTVPFIRAYEQLDAMHTNETTIQNIQQNRLPVTPDITRIIEGINRIQALKLRYADKYLFTASAIELHQAVHSPGVIGDIPTISDIWIEVHAPLTSLYGDDVKAIYFHNAYPIGLVDKTYPISKDDDFNETLSQVFTPYKKLWSLHIINSRCKLVFDLTWVPAVQHDTFLGSHICPYGDCKYIPTHNPLEESTCIPCEKCKLALAYWFSWLYTALRIINRDYATSHEPDTSPYPIDSQPYQAIETKIVGHGKNKRRIKETVTRKVDYRLITFDATPTAPKLPASVPNKDAGTSQRGNWLTLADKDTIIYEYRQIDTSKGRTLNPERNPRWKHYQHIPVTPYKKYVPMLRAGKHTIKRVIASKRPTDNQPG